MRHSPLVCALNGRPSLPLAQSTLMCLSTPNGALQAEPVSPCGTCRQVIIETETRFKQAVRIILYGTKRIYVMDGIKQLMPLSFTEFQ